jgi:hypothetical protein
MMFIVIASVLATFNITNPLDKEGNEIKPDPSARATAWLFRRLNMYGFIT